MMFRFSCSRKATTSSRRRLREIARHHRGRAGRFDAALQQRLADLLKAVVAFATGGRKALADQNTEAARLLLTQMK